MEWFFVRISAVVGIIFDYFLVQEIFFYLFPLQITVSLLNIVLKKFSTKIIVLIFWLVWTICFRQSLNPFRLVPNILHLNLKKIILSKRRPPSQMLSIRNDLSYLFIRMLGRANKFSKLGDLYEWLICIKNLLIHRR